MPNGIRRVPLPPKVRSFQAEIGGDEQVAAGLRPQDGAVIANPC